MKLPIRGEYPEDWVEIAYAVKEEAGWRCIRCDHPDDRDSGHLLTVHHFDGNKSNCQWWNLLALCQRCHLSIQARVNPEQPYMFEHSDWLKPYVAGFYASKYLGKDLPRMEVVSRQDELLGLERLV
jgi:5-methylcytosine-specific restriction endonuclease McrA